MDFSQEQEKVLRNDLLRYNPVIAKNSCSYPFANKLNEENYNFSDEGKLNQLEINYVDEGKETEEKPDYSAYARDTLFNDGTNSFFNLGLDTEPHFLDCIPQFNTLSNHNTFSYDFQSMYDDFCEGYHTMDSKENLEKKQLHYFDYSDILEQLYGEEEELELKQNEEEIKSNDDSYKYYPIDSICLGDESYYGKTLEQELRLVNKLNVFSDENSEDETSKVNYFSDNYHAELAYKSFNLGFIGKRNHKLEKELRYFNFIAQFDDQYAKKSKSKPQPKPTQSEDTICSPPFDFLCPTDIDEWIFEPQNSWNDVFPLIDDIFPNTKSIGIQTNSFSKTIGTETDFSSTSTGVGTQTDFSSTSTGVGTQTDFQSISAGTQTEIKTTQTIGTQTESEIKDISTSSKSENDTNVFNLISQFKPKTSTTTTTIATQTNTENLWAIIPYVPLCEIIFPKENDKKEKPHIIPCVLQKDIYVPVSSPVSIIPMAFPKYESKLEFFGRVFENSEFLRENVSNVLIPIKNSQKEIKDMEDNFDKDWVMVNKSKQDDEWELI